MGKFQKNINKIAEEKDLKLTSKREEILKIFLENNKKHLSAEDIYLIIKKRNFSIGVTTIYRTLDLFVEEGIISKRDFGDDSAKYEFAYKEENRKHHHLICKNCGKVIEVSGLLVDNLESKLLNDEGFKVVDHCLKIYGYCKECRSGENIN